MNFGGSPLGVGGAPGALHNPNNDVIVPNCPDDGISSVAFSPGSLRPKNFLVAGSWSNEVRCWEVQQSGQSQPVGMIKHDGPVLSVAWAQDGQAIFSGGCDNVVKMWSIATNSDSIVAKHDAPIRSVVYTSDIGNGSPALVTGSWDKTVRYWDFRSPTGVPIGTVNVPDRVYSMDGKGNLLVVATAERKIVVYDTRKPSTPYAEKLTQLKFQTRAVRCFPDALGFVVGSVEGRCSIDHIQDHEKKNDFAFKCHRDKDNQALIYSVNALAFHEGFGTFATAGSDGGISFWDKENKQRLKEFERVNQPITSVDFNCDGQIFAYAVSYDWSRGAENYDPATNKNYILLHGVKEEEVKGKKQAGRTKGR